MGEMAAGDNRAWTIYYINVSSYTLTNVAAAASVAVHRNSNCSSTWGPGAVCTQFQFIGANEMAVGRFYDNAAIAYRLPNGALAQMNLLITGMRN